MLNDVLVNLFRDIMDIEQRAVTCQEFPDITSNDLHVIEGLVGKVATIELSDGEGALTHALIRDMGAGWVRLECDAPRAVFPTPVFSEKECPRRVLKLVDLADIAGFAIEEDDR